MNFLNKLSLSLFFSFCVVSTASAQKMININSTEKLHLRSESVLLNNPSFSKTERVRAFNYNPRLRSSPLISEGDTLALDFFEDKKYQAVITSVSENEGRVNIASKILDGTNLSFCYIVTSEKGITISADLPLKDEHFSAAALKGKTYLAESKMSKLMADELPCGGDLVENLPADNLKNISVDGAPIGEVHLRKSDYDPSYYEACHSLDEPTEIVLMFVYTPAAEEWALQDWRTSDIDDLIDITMLSMNQVMINSQTGITFRLAHKHKTDYVELDNSTDLSNIRSDGDGFMDEVHPLRAQYKADLVVFMPFVSFTGGLAGLLNTEAGNSEWCGFSLSRVQQASWTHTTVHEIGHNMGVGHHKKQITQAGPGLYEYSAGWRGVFPKPDTNGNPIRYSTVMTYENGVYFEDGFSHPRIPYFSSPDIVVDDEVIGHTTEANAVLTLKKTKYLTSKYSDERYYVSISNHGTTYSNSSYSNFRYNETGPDLKDGDVLTLFCETDNSVGTYPIYGRIMRGDADVSCEYNQYISTGSLNISPRSVTIQAVQSQKSTYTGDQLYVAVPTIYNTIGEHNIAISYLYEKDGVTTDHALGAGIYNVTISTSGDKNYRDNTRQVMFTVNKAEALILVEDKTASYTGAPIEIDVTQATPSDATLDITYTGQNVVYPESVQAPSEEGIYTVKVNFAGDDNYLAKEVTSQLTITAKLTGIPNEKADNELLKVYPTSISAGDFIHVEMNDNSYVSENTIVEFYNMAGVCVLSTKLLADRTSVQVPQLAGTYIVKVKTDGKLIDSRRIIVK